MPLHLPEYYYYINSSALLFTVDIKALKEVWIVGDQFLYDTFTAFQAMKSRAAMNNECLPYLHDFYDVHCAFQRPLHRIRLIEKKSSTLLSICSTKR